MNTLYASQANRYENVTTKDIRQLFNQLGKTCVQVTF